jgi:hypothetical protein
MRVFIYFTKENLWIVDEGRIRIVTKRLFIDDEQIEEYMGDAILGHVVKIIPRGVKEQYFQGQQFVYEAEETHIYTLPYLFVKHFRDEFEEPEEMAIRVKRVEEA